MPRINKFITPMELAIKKAKLAAMQDEVPVGAVITHNNEIIAACGNKMRQNNNLLDHAEILAINQAMSILGTDRLTDCNIYVTLEPCTMCSAAIATARIKRLYYGARDIKMGAVESGVNFFNQSSCLHKPEIYSALYENECRELMVNFFQDKRLVK